MDKSIVLDEATLLRQRVKKLEKQRKILLVLFILITAPISIPLILGYVAFQKLKRRKGWNFGSAGSGQSELKALRQQVAAQIETIEAMTQSRKGWRHIPVGTNSRVRDGAIVPETYHVLIWCSISTSGLTTQLTQITEILRNLNVRYRISYHRKPVKEHPECIHWIDRDLIQSPRVVFFLERFEPFETGFPEALKVFYLNNDWLTDRTRSFARAYADVVWCPTPFRLQEIRDMMPNARVTHLPWPSNMHIEERSLLALDGEPLNVLYFGNDYDTHSRKSPIEVVDAILKYSGSGLTFTLKFRTPLPDDIRAALQACEHVVEVIETPLTDARVDALYRAADVCLAPCGWEGNGLTLIEAIAKSTVPAVLRGHPMIDVVSEEEAFFVDCEEYAQMRNTPAYRTTADALLAAFDQMTPEAVRARQKACIARQAELEARHAALEKEIRTVLEYDGIHPRTAPLKIDVDLEGAVASVPATVSPDPVAVLNCRRPVKRIDVFMSTYKRADHLRSSLSALIAACEASPYEHFLTVLVDAADPETDAVLQEFDAHIARTVRDKTNMGLPFVWNTVLDLSWNQLSRSEERADHIFYIQDDCLITEPETFFETMVAAAEHVHPARLGAVSGFYTEVHPGFHTAPWNGRDMIYSRSIDGKCFMMRPDVLWRIGKLTWWFEDGMRRGNPGPTRGSHFDLWQWLESPNSLSAQGRVSVILPGLCSHTAQSQDDSTWNNATSDANTRERISKGHVYH